LKGVSVPKSPLNSPLFIRILISQLFLNQCKDSYILRSYLSVYGVRCSSKIFCSYVDERYTHYILYHFTVFEKQRPFNSNIEIDNALQSFFFNFSMDALVSAVLHIMALVSRTENLTLTATIMELVLKSKGKK
jgi:hypothetical protein